MSESVDPGEFLRRMRGADSRRNMEGVAKIRRELTFPCPVCGEADWREVRPSLGFSHRAFCACGKGEAGFLRRHDGMRTGGKVMIELLPSTWFVRDATADQRKALRAWERDEPVRYLDKPPEIVVSCPNCKEEVTIRRGEFDAEHSGGCTCGTILTIGLPDVERQEYQSELAYWQAKKPPIGAWRLARKQDSGEGK